CCNAPVCPSNRWATAPVPSRRSDMRTRTFSWPVAVVLAAGLCTGGLAMADQPAVGSAGAGAAMAMDVDGTTPLHWAVYRNDLEAVKRLLKAGADARARNDYGATPLSEAAVTGNVEVIRRLLDAGAD